jgi:hypothetical protein
MTRPHTKLTAAVTPITSFVAGELNSSLCSFHAYDGNSTALCSLDCFLRSLRDSDEYFTAPFNTSQTRTDALPPTLDIFLRFRDGDNFPWAPLHVYRRLLMSSPSATRLFLCCNSELDESDGVQAHFSMRAAASTGDGPPNSRPAPIDAERVEPVVSAAFHTGPGITRSPVDTAVHDGWARVDRTPRAELPQNRASRRI